MYVIGFTTKFYTLWDVNTFEKWIQVGSEYRLVERTSFQYLRNLSFDRQAAEEKVKAFWMKVWNTV